jgi:hypothetical protein
MGNCLKLQRAASWADDHEWEDEVVVGKGTTAAVEKVDRCVEVKMRVTKRQLQELLEKQTGGRDGTVRQRQVKKVLAELMTSGVVCYQPPHGEMMRGQWRPSLHSIPEAAEES